MSNKEQSLAKKRSKTARRREQRKKQKQSISVNFETEVRSASTYRGATLRPLSTLAERIPQDNFTRLIGIVKGQMADKSTTGPRTAIYDNGYSIAVEKELLDGIVSRNMTPDRDKLMLLDVLENEAFWAIEAAQREKFGPYRDASWKDVRPKLAAYYGDTEELPLLDSPMMEEVMREIARELQYANGGALVPATVDAAFQQLPKNTFYGYPWFTSQWAEIPGVSEETVDKAKKLHDLDPVTCREYIDAPWMCFNRVVPNGEHKNKIRATLAPAKFGSLFEKTFTMPVLAAFKMTPWAKGYAGDHVVGAYIRYTVRTCEVIFSMDYETFDQFCRRRARAFVRDVLKEAFDHKYDDQLNLMFEAFDFPEVICPDGVLTPDDDPNADFGLGSGIGPTGIIGTIWNRACAKVLERLMQSEHGITLKAHYGYGDDTILAWDGHVIPVEWFAEKLLTLGMRINPSKQEYSWGDQRYASFLGKQYYYLKRHGICSRGVYSLFRAWCRILYKDVQKEQEDKWIRENYEGLSSVGCDMLDTIAVLRETEGHPFHYAFVELVRLGHPLLLKSTHYLRDHTFGETIAADEDGLKAFRTVQHICRLESMGLDTTGKEEENWERYALFKYAKSVHRSKGFLLTARQAAQYLKGEKVEWDLEQLAIANAIGSERRQPLSERVIELEARKGVVLTEAQINDLRFNRKIRWSEGQRETMQWFGNLPDSEKDMWRQSIRERVATREVVNDRPEFDFDRLWSELQSYRGVLC